MGAAYHGFLEEAERCCRQKCGEDLQSTTRYVTWSLHTKSRASLKSMLNRVRHLAPNLALPQDHAQSGEPALAPDLAVPQVHARPGESQLERWSGSAKMMLGKARDVPKIKPW